MTDPTAIHEEQTAQIDQPNTIQQKLSSENILNMTHEMHIYNVIYEVKKPNLTADQS